MSAARLGPAQGLVVLALIAICATLGNGNDGTGDLESWKAVSTAGQVQSLGEPGAGLDWVAVSRGDLLRPRSVIRTLGDGEVTLSNRSGVLMVDSRTRLRLPAASAGAPRLAAQDSGTVIYETAGGSETPLGILTPALELSSARGVFGVTVEGGWTLVSVDSGFVEIRQPGADDGMDVRPGEAVRVRAADGKLEMLEREGGRHAFEASAAARRGAWKRHRHVQRVVARLDDELVRAEDGEEGLLSEGEPRRP